MLFGLVLNIKTQLTGCGLYPLTCINISRQASRRHASIPMRRPAPTSLHCGDHQHQHTSTSRILFSLRCVNIHFIA
ncbi:hypothetical protein ACVXG7_00430 [Enterobacter hormaechei]